MQVMRPQYKSKQLARPIQGFLLSSLKIVTVLVYQHGTLSSLFLQIRP